MYSKLNVKQIKTKTKHNMINIILIYHMYTMLITSVNSQLQRENIINLNNTGDPSSSYYMDSTNSSTTDGDDDGGGGVSNHNSNYHNPSNISNSINNVKCGNTQKMADNCFRDLPPHLMEFLQTTKIAINEQDIVSKCNVFRRGMKCFDDYTSRCIPQNNINILNNNVEGARKFFTKFCEDKAFQNDYLSHKECFSYIQEDWMHCTKSFQNILADGIHSDKNVTEKFLEFCCARYAYETCIYNSARYKCYKNSATFARATAQMLSDEKHFSNCRQFEVSTCSSTPVILQTLHCHWTLWLAISLLLMRQKQMPVLLAQSWRLSD